MRARACSRTRAQGKCVGAHNGPPSSHMYTRTWIHTARLAHTITLPAHPQELASRFANTATSTARPTGGLHRCAVRIHVPPSAQHDLRTILRAQPRAQAQRERSSTLYSLREVHAKRGDRHLPNYRIGAKMTIYQIKGWPSGSADFYLRA
eukprot:675317-Pleurochrysis_carterae.AAC.1